VSERAAAIRLYIGDPKYVPVSSERTASSLAINSRERHDHAHVVEALSSMDAELTERTEALAGIATKQSEALALIEQNGFIFMDIGNEPGNWQHLAFTLYSMLCEIDVEARNALGLPVGATDAPRTEAA